jgi:hypothetical protein
MGVATDGDLYRRERLGPLITNCLVPVAHLGPTQTILSLSFPLHIQHDLSLHNMIRSQLDKLPIYTISRRTYTQEG